MKAAVLGLVVGLISIQVGCQSCRSEKSKKQQAFEPTPLTGLDAIPDEVGVLVGADVEALRSAWLVERAIAQMFRRDPELRQNINRLIETCTFDPAKDLDGVIMALGKGAAAEEAVMVVTGTFVEPDLASCVSQSVAQDGGTLTVTQASDQTAAGQGGMAGRTVYEVRGSSTQPDRLWFTVAGPRTIVVATSPGWLERAVGNGPKARSAKHLTDLLKRVDRKAGLWAVGEVDASIGAGLVELSKGEVAKPPQAMFIEVALRAGLKVEFGAIMGSAEDANLLLSKIKGQLQLGSWILQTKGFGKIASKLGVDADDKTVYLRLSLDDREVKEVLAEIDTAARSNNDPAPN